MARREFSTAVYAQIVNRAMNANGHIVCEGCGLVLGKKPYHIDHTIADALVLDKSRALTAADGKLLGVKCCHAPKTKIDVRNIAEAKRREAVHHGFKRRSGPPMPGTKASGLKKCMDGTVQRRSAVWQFPRDSEAYENDD